MILNIDSILYHVVVDENKLDSDLLPIIFLHGFTGQAKDCEFIFDKLPNNYLPISIDLIGHGKTDHPEELDFYTTEAQVDHLKQIIEQLNLHNVILCGYSMGGRLALSFTVRFPHLVKSLILESTTAGIENTTERRERYKNDQLLADKIVNEGIDEFINYWMNIPLFASLRKLQEDKFSHVFNTKLMNNPIGLANSLRGFSSGRMPSNWDKLKTLTQNTLLITGELDQKYCEINKQINSQLQNSEHIIIPSCGHNVHLENPEEFIILVNQFLNK